MTADPGDPAQQSARIVDLLLNTETLDGFLHALAVAAMTHAPKANGCGITLRSEGRFLTVSSAGTNAPALDEKQYGLDRGPCLEALRTGTEIRIVDMKEERRWAPYPAHAMACGARSSLSFPIAARTGTAGALNLYSPQPYGFEDIDLTALRALAAQATGAIALARRMTDSKQFTDDVQQALHHRGVIDQAIGVVIAQQGCSAGQAFAILRKASQNRNVKLRELCVDLIARLTGNAPPDPPGLRPRPL
ncbi:GAF and ANTAR domain-containing protein [Streptomyces sp. NPDC047525]|uniref:GAF and ANTAR domain-containing protein n=1 Tax=Streptomyces sp. NPDC047525 TaxID=3155264 RepID=UPI0033C2756C